MNTSLRVVCLGWLALVLATSPVRAEFLNGGFESDYANWTIRHLTNPSAIPTFPPSTESHLGLANDAANRWSQNIGLGVVSTDVVGNGTDAHAPQVAFPLFGQKAARINYHGNQNRASAITQLATLGVPDIDPADGKVHVRFAIAPVLQNPGHNPAEQPYFFVEVTNVTKGTQLFYTFNFSNQPGVPWQTVGGYQYTNWQSIDVAPGAGRLDVGDQVRVTIIASGCGPSGHEGHVYVDSGSGLNSLPGPFVTATGPQFTQAGGTIVYNYSYSNGGTASMPDSVVTVKSPQDNTGGAPQNLRVVPSSVAAAGCSYTTAGTVDTVTCPVGTLNPGNAGVLQLSFVAPAVPVGPLNHGDYGISSASSPFLLGPLLQTNVTASPLADLSITVNDGVSAVQWGQGLTYNIVATNGGPSVAPAGALITSTAPASLTNLSWTCTAAGGATCPNASGTGTINETTAANWPAGGTLTYTVQATASGSGTGTITHSASVTAPGGVVDPDTANNTGADVDNVGPGLRALTLNKAGGGQGNVTSVLAGVNCGTACATQNVDFPLNSSVVLYASAPPGSIFAGWSGGGCSGMATSCVVTMDAAKAVVATFALPLNVTTVVTGPGGSAAPGNGVVQPVVAGGTVSYTITPSAGYAPVITDTCGPAGAQTGGTLVGNTYTTNAVSQSCTVDISFTNAGVVTVTPSVGANGSITPNAPKSVASGGAVSYLVTPNSGYVASAPGGTCPAGTWAGNVYTIGPVAADCTVAFGFAAGVQVTSSVASGSGTVTPASATIASGGQVQFTFAPAAGFSAAIDAGSTCPAGTWVGNVYTVPNIVANCNVAARFDPITYTVTASVGSGSGTASPPVQAVAHGNSTVITLAPGAGQRARLAAASTCVGSFSANNTVFTVANVTANCSAVFDFSTSIVSVPTLSEMGLVILGLLMMFTVWLRQLRRGDLTVPRES